MCKTTKLTGLSMFLVITSSYDYYGGVALERMAAGDRFLPAAQCAFNLLSKLSADAHIIARAPVYVLVF